MYKQTIHYIWSLVIISAIGVTVYLSVKYIKDSINEGTYRLYTNVQEIDSCDVQSVTIKVSGTFTKKGDPQENKKINIILDDGIGNRIAKVMNSDSEGFFSGTILCTEYTSRDSLDVVIVRAYDGNLEFERYFSINGKSISDRPASMKLRFPILLLIFFILSFVVPFAGIKPSWKFLFSIFFAFVFSFGMIFSVAFGLHYLNKTCEDYDNLTLGFASVFYNKYDINESDEWILSLNSYHIQEDGTVKGFGVPLWVLFLSVIGSGLYTITLIGGSIQNRPRFKELDKNFIEETNQLLMSEEYIGEVEDPKSPESEKKELEKFRIFHNDIIRHQLYILFSPIASIFVFQVIVATGAGANGIVVSLAALGSGLTFNIILNRAMHLAQESISPKQTPVTDNGEEE